MASNRQKYPREYRIWKAMRARCYSPCNKNMGSYQKMHIIVCKRWDSFDNFIADMGSCPDGFSIDRIDNSGNYEPSNCRWVSFDVQAKNRGSFNKIYTYNGETMCLKDWAKKFGIKYITLHMRIKRHPEMSFEELIKFCCEKDELIEYNNQKYTRTQLCETFNIPKNLFYDRWHRGWSIERIINTPKLTSRYDKRNCITNRETQGTEL